MFSKAKDGKFDWLVNGVTAILTSLTHSHFVIAINYKPEEFTQAGLCTLKINPLLSYLQTPNFAKPLK
jgi:hypothetical protein